MGTTELAPRQEQAAQVLSEASAVLPMIERLATNPDADVAKLEKLMELHERAMRRQAEAAFNAAFSDMQGALPVIAERGKTNNGRYAPLEDIIETVRPILKQFGFALSHRTEWPSQTLVKVIGVLMHRDGHSRESEFLSSADSSGNKNAIQALGSAVHYGRRYTTNDLLCIVTREMDDDAGSAAKPVRQAPKGFEAWWADFQSVADEGHPKLQAAWNQTSREIREHASAHYRDALAALKAKAKAVQE